MEETHFCKRQSDNGEWVSCITSQFEDHGFALITESQPPKVKYVEKCPFCEQNTRLARKEEGKIEPFWISVKDEKPRLGQHVIMKVNWINVGGFPRKATSMSAIYTDAIDGEPRFCNLSLEDSYPDCEYWFPLPNLEEKHKYLVKVRNFYNLYTDEYYLIESGIEDLGEDNFHEGLIGDYFAKIEVEREFVCEEDTEITKLSEMNYDVRSCLEKELAASLLNERYYAEFDDRRAIEGSD